MVVLFCLTLTSKDRKTNSGDEDLDAGLPHKSQLPKGS